MNALRKDNYGPWNLRHVLSNDGPMHLINLIDYLQFAVSLVGTPITTWLLIVMWGDLRWMLRHQINGIAKRQQKARIRQESLRLCCQLLLLWASVVSVALRPEIPNFTDAYKEYQIVVLHRSFMMMGVTILLAFKSLMARFDREFIESQIEQQPRLPSREPERNLQE